MLKELREDMEKRRQQCVKKKKKKGNITRWKAKKTKRNSAAEKYNNWNLKFTWERQRQIWIGRRNNQQNWR